MGPWSGTETPADRARERKQRRFAWLAILAGIVGFVAWKGVPDWVPAPLRFSRGGEGGADRLPAPSSSVPSVSPEAPAAPAPARLELVEWRWGVKQGYAVAEGRVTNVSRDILSNVQAVVKWTTKSGDLVTSLGALVDANPLAPGVTTPFRVRVRSDPAMATGTIDFRQLGGPAIPWRNAGR